MPQLRRLPVGWVVSKQENECCSLSRFTLKLSDFFVRTEWKHFLKICPSIYDETKLGNNFQIEQHSYGNFMQISEKTIFSARSYWFTILFISFWTKNALNGPVRKICVQKIRSGLFPTDACRMFLCFKTDRKRPVGRNAVGGFHILYEKIALWFLFGYFYLHLFTFIIFLCFICIG